MVEVQRDSTATPVTTTTTTTTTTYTQCCCYNYLYFICITIPIFIYDGIALLLYTIILLPAFIRMIYYYFCIANCSVIKYNTNSVRQTLDIYWPTTTTTTTTPPPPDDTTEVCRSNRNHTSNRNMEEEDVETIQHRLQSDIRPIIVFVCGGAWMIGYKMWGTLLARVLTTYCGITVILPDYRNYPFWGTIPDQINDIDNVLQWIFNQITPLSSTSASTTRETSSSSTTTTTTNEIPTRRKVILVGQSAGGHLVMTLLLRKVLNCTQSLSTTMSDNNTTNITTDIPTSLIQNDSNDNNINSINNNSIHPYHVSDLTGLIVLSAPLDLQSVYTSTFRKHGLSESFMKSMFSPAEMNDYNPLQLLEQIQLKQQLQIQQEQQLNGIETNLWNQLPPIKVFHGNCDRTVPYEGSIRFVELFQQLSSLSSLSMSAAEDGNTSTSSNISFHIYEGWSHTDPILEGPMDADHRFHSDIVTTIQDWIHQDDNGDKNNNNDNNDIEDRSITPNLNNIYWPDDEAALPVMRRLCPHLLIRMGRFCMPF